VGWLEDLAGGIVGLDTSPFIYYVEANPAYTPIIDPFFDALDRGELRVVTSIITVLETEVRPMRDGDAALVARYDELLLETLHIDTREVTTAVAREATRLRARYNLRTPDALQIATALHAGANAFLTNDQRLAIVPDITVLVLDALRVERIGTEQEGQG